MQYLGSADIQLLDSDSRVEYVTLQGKSRRYQLPLVMILHCSMSHQPFAWMIICDTGTTYLKHVSYYIIHTHTYLQLQNNRWQNRKEYKGKTNWAQSLLVFTLAVVPARQHPQSTYVPHAQPVVGNGGGRRVRHGITGLAPLPLDSTLQGILHCGNPTLRKWRRRHRTFLFCHLKFCAYNVYCTLCTVRLVDLGPFPRILKFNNLR